MVVKVPSGMKEADLARPVIEVRSFEDGKLKYEIYAYGEQTVVMPIEGIANEDTASAKAEGLMGLAARSIAKEISRYDEHPIVEITSQDSARVAVSRRNIAKIIGKGGRNIERIQEKLGVHIDLIER
jgi:ATPase